MFLTSHYSNEQPDQNHAKLDIKSTNNMDSKKEKNVIFNVKLN